MSDCSTRAWGKPNVMLLRVDFENEEQSLMYTFNLDGHKIERVVINGVEYVPKSESDNG